jgi:hypothetical protein
MNTRHFACANFARAKELTHEPAVPFSSSAITCWEPDTTT